MSSILLVEDDESLGQTIRERLQKEHHHVFLATTLADAKKIALDRNQRIDLCIIDIGLSDGSGLDLARDLRVTRPLPFVFLTAMNSAEYRLEGFELGADDYIPKPFHLKEFLLRIDRVLAQKGLSGVRTYGPLGIDFERQTVSFQDGSITSPQTADFNVLRILIEAAPRPLSRQEIASKLKQAESAIVSRTIDNTVVRLRQLLEKAGCECIKTVRGTGYQWVLPVGLVGILFC